MDASFLKYAFEGRSGRVAQVIAYLMGLTPVAVFLWLLFGSASSPGRFGGQPPISITAMIGWAASFLALPLVGYGAYMLYRLLTTKQGLLEERKKVRYNSFGQMVSTKKELEDLKPTSRMIEKHFAPLFRSFVYRAIGSKTAEEFGTEMLERLQTPYKGSEDAMLRGDLKAAAEALYPFSIAWDERRREFVFEGRFEMHVPGPIDMEPSLFDHGRLITGQDISFLTPRLLTEGTVRNAYVASIERCVEDMYTLPKVFLVILIGTIALIAAPLGAAMGSFLGVIFATFSGLCAATAACLIVALRMAKAVLHVRSVNGACQHIINSDDSLRTVSQDLSRHKEDSKNIGSGIEAWRNALKATYRDPFPTFSLGRATGHALAHGFAPFYSYRENQIVSFSWDDLSKGGMAIFGGVGSGKTFSVILPYTRQMMRARFAHNPEMKCAGLFFDMKAVLHYDVIRIAREENWDCRIIGVGEDEWGIDLYDGLSPLMATQTVTEICRQRNSGGTGSEPFFPIMSANARRAANYIAQAFQRTNKGMEWIRQNGELIYSIAGSERLAMSCRDPGGHLWMAIDAVTRAIQDPSELPYLHDLCTPTLKWAINFLRVDMYSRISEATAGSILGTVSSELSDFVSHPLIRDRFGAARGRILAIDDVWNHKTATCVNMSAFEFADAAKTINLAIKVRVYHHAAVRQMRDPKIGTREKLTIVIDEFQEFVSRNSMYSEARMTNILRSMGVNLVVAAQGISCLYEALGSRDAVENMLSQMRAVKVFLGSNERKMVDYVKDIVPMTLQALMTTENGYESVLTQRLALHGSIADHIDYEKEPDLTADELMLRSHPLCHGHVQPYIRGRKPGMDKQIAQAGHVDYESVYAAGDDSAGVFGKAAELTRNISHKLLSLASASAADSSIECPKFERKPVYDDLNLPLGMAVVVVTRGSQWRTDMVRLFTENDFFGDVIEAETGDSKPAITGAPATGNYGSEKAVADRNAAAANFAAQPA